MNSFLYNKIYCLVPELFSVLVTGSVNISRAYINAGRFDESLHFAVPAGKYLLMLHKNVQSYSDIEVSIFYYDNFPYNIKKYE